MISEFSSKWKALVPENGRVLLAVSGGVDSLCLAELCLRSGVQNFAVAHCNFHLRAEESDGDESCVQHWCDAHGVQMFRTDFDTLRHAADNGISTEMAARELRYRYFAQLCTEEGFCAVAVAHNANDNAETLVLNLLRRTGIRGICGMSEKSDIYGTTVIRPMLTFSRDRIEQWMRDAGCTWREDSTNKDSAFNRNRVRNRIFPEFAMINPSFLSVLNGDMQHFAQVAAVADEYWSEAKKRIISRRDDGLEELCIPALASEKHREYLLWRFVESAGLSGEAFSGLVRLLTSGENGTISGKCFVGSNARVLTAPGRIVLSDLHEYTNSKDITMIYGPGDYGTLALELVPYSNGMERCLTPGCLIVDAKKIEFPLKLRHWNNGDWMCPFGMGGRRKKLSDIFTELKYSADEKMQVPVVELSGSRVGILPGYRIDDSLRVTSNTTKVLLIRVR